jgi:hypothetical protein
VVEGRTRQVVEGRIRQMVEGRTSHVVEGRTKQVVDGRTRQVVEGRTRHVVEGRTRQVVYGRTRQVVEGRTRQVVEGRTRQVVEGSSGHTSSKLKFLQNQNIIKGCLIVILFCDIYAQKILEPSPINMGGTDKNFKISRYRYNENKILKREGFFATPFRKFF